MNAAQGEPRKHTVAPFQQAERCLSRAGCLERFAPLCHEFWVLRQHWPIRDGILSDEAASPVATNEGQDSLAGIRGNSVRPRKRGSLHTGALKTCSGIDFDFGR